MASIILQQLKIKGTPKKQEDVKVKINNIPAKELQTVRAPIISEKMPISETIPPISETIPPISETIPISKIETPMASTNTHTIYKTIKKPSSAVPITTIGPSSKRFPIIRDLTMENKMFDLQSFKKSIKPFIFEEKEVFEPSKKLSVVIEEKKSDSLSPVAVKPSIIAPIITALNIPPKKRTIKTKKVGSPRQKAVPITIKTDVVSVKPSTPTIASDIEAKTDVAITIPKIIKKTIKKTKVPEGITTTPITTVKKTIKKTIKNTKIPTTIQEKEKEQKQITVEKYIEEKKEYDINNRVKDYKYKIKAEPSYFMNNRKKFIEFITNVFNKKYKDELKSGSSDVSCDSLQDDSDAGFNPMAHQKIVRDYINTYSPYRGVLLYHGLGSGKTCSSIIIAEGMKSEKEIMVLTPASLRANYREQLKKCGDLLYVKNQFWEFIDVVKNPEHIQTLSELLSIPNETIKRKGGAWLVNMNKPSNYNTLNLNQKKSLDDQIDQMIDNKYQFISYNGLRKQNIKEMTRNYTINPFDNKVIIIDEAHNFVSKIVNKINTKKSDVMSIQLYEYLMEAVNVKIVLLSGTPIINYPNEIAILFNILRGKIKTWTLDLEVKPKNRNTMSTEYFKSIFKSTTIGGNISDYIEYTSAKNLVITRNPYKFVNKTVNEEYAGIRVSDNDRGILTDEDFSDKIKKLLASHDISVKNIKIDKYKLLPDKLDEFNSYFIRHNGFSNSELFKRRILGLTSYFRSAQESLMPAYTKKDNFHIVNIPMSDFQFGAYETARAIERKEEKRMALKQTMANKPEDIYSENMTSTYRVYSRSFCNFVFPHPEIKRPMLDREIKVNEDEIDMASQEEMMDNVDGLYEADDIMESESEVKSTVASSVSGKTSATTIESKRKVYRDDVIKAIDLLDQNKEKFLIKEKLDKLSPKFLSILNNILNKDNIGLHLIYSQFRTLEGIGILKLVLEANGFAQLKIKLDSKNTWKLDMKQEDFEKPKFALYTGKESVKEKEIMRNIFNGNFKYVPEALMKEITNMSSLINTSKNNMYGEFIKVLMISSSGAEGINLKNVRFVHITEPYWHPVRMEQVIGRARRICSHNDLPKELRTVDVFLYLMNITDAQKKKSIELSTNDISRIDGKSTVSTDQTLYEIASIKDEITQNILTAVKESAFDCRIHSSSSDEKIKCFTFGDRVSSNSFATVPSIENEVKDEEVVINREAVEIKTKIVEIGKKEYAYDPVTSNLYDKDSIINKNPILVGTLEKTGKTFKLKLL